MPLQIKVFYCGLPVWSWTFNDVGAIEIWMVNPPYAALGEKPFKLISADEVDEFLISWHNATSVEFSYQ